MDYSGTVFANSYTCNGCLGFVFGYQNNHKFYVAIWRHNHLNFPPDYAAGVMGLQIKVIIALGRLFIENIAVVAVLTLEA